MSIINDRLNKCAAQGHAALATELQLDMQRLWLRNLGRDDRLIG